jgi:hypothetical protein
VLVSWHFPDDYEIAFASKNAAAAAKPPMTIV